jgi:Response regulator containing CheY-like receiver domain and AraC-type DNA-binding domain
MLKLMVVDDEIIFRQYLKDTFDWESYGFTIVGEARNGIEALEQAVSHHPDIALVDINMPFMDGLTLTEKLKTNFPEMAVLLISGHSEFEYAQKAVKLGVVDYILKPFEKQELIEALGKLQTKLLKKQEDDALLANSNTLIIEKIFSSLIRENSELNEAQLIKDLEGAGVKLCSFNFQVVVAEIEFKNSILSGEGKVNLFLNQWCRDCQDVLGGFVIFEDGEGRPIFITEQGEASSLIQKSNLQLQKLFDQAFKQDLCITIGVGSVYTGLKGIRASYLEALTALQSRFLAGGGGVIEFSSLEHDCFHAVFYPSEIQEDLLVNLRLNDWVQVREKIDIIFDLIRNRRMTMDYAYVTLIGLVSLCLSHLTQYGLEAAVVYGPNFFPYHEIRNCKSVEASYDWILDLFRRAIEYTGGHRLTKSYRIMENVKNFIQAHYSSSELSVEEVSRNVYINPSYLRAVCQKELGMSVSEYITALRMQKAKELLNNGNKKFSDIAEMVGYTDASYFSKCFKKYYGMSPSEYENTKIPHSNEN